MGCLASSSNGIVLNMKVTRWRVIGVTVPLLAIALVTWGVVSTQSSDQPRTIIAERGTVTQDVTFTGQLEAVNSAVLSFEITGTVDQVLVEVGDEVSEGDALVSLDLSSAELTLAKALATRAAGQQKTKLSWAAAETNWENAVAEQDQIVAKKRQAVIAAEAELNQAKEVAKRTASEDGADTASAATAKKLELAAASTYRAAQGALTEARQTATKTGDTARGIADVERAQYLATIQAAANVSGLSFIEAAEAIERVNLTKNVLVAPFTGVVTIVDIKSGETVTAADVVVAVATVRDLRLTANVTETDAVKINVDMPATITFDALPAFEQFEASVTKRAPAAIAIEGVPTYEVTLTLTTIDPRLLPGLTSNITIHASEKTDVIAVPRRAVITRGDQQFVRVISAGEIIELEVTTGLLGSSGAIEITSGLQGGEQVIIEAILEP